MHKRLGIGNPWGCIGPEPGKKSFLHHPERPGMRLEPLPVAPFAHEHKRGKILAAVRLRSKCAGVCIKQCGYIFLALFKPLYGNDVTRRCIGG